MVPSRCSLEDHGAVLPVEGEIGDVDGAGAAVDGGGQPVDAAVGGHQHVGVEGDFKRPIDAGWGKRWAQPQTVPRGQLPPPVWGYVPIAPSPYLFSRTMSGSQTMVEGTRSSWMLSYFSGSHRRR